MSNMHKRWFTLGACAALLLAGCSSSGGGSPVSADLQLPVAFGLVRDQAGLAQQVEAISTPGSLSFMQWMTPSDIASTFGASQADADAALSTLTAAGFTGSLDPTGSALIGTMSAGAAQAFFGTDIVETPQGSGLVVAGPAKPISPPDSISSAVSEVVGLTALLPAAGAASSAPAPASSAVACPPAKGLADALKETYGLSALQSAGNTGKGVRIAMLEVAPTSQQALDLYESCFHATIAPVTVTMVDDSPASVFGDVAQESTLDILAASLMAPGLDGIDVYQFNPFSPIVFPFAKALSSAYAPGGAQIISTSVGFCETDLTEQAVALNEWLLMTAAATGVTVVASSGDTGSSACAPGSNDQASQYPSSSPNVLSVGGTQSNTAGDLTSGQQVWNSSPNYAGGGSTVSSLPQPGYQTSLGISGGRITPDVAFLSAPADFGPIPVCTTAGSCEFTVVGGTSATAPGVAGGIANVLQSLGSSSSTRIGLPNWALYATATTTGATNFTDVTVGTNDLYSVGCCTAAPGFDPASGWGSAQFSAVANHYRNLMASMG
jgi:subtilase family serine protease